jgi:hypothetical protein
MDSLLQRPGFLLPLFLALLVVSTCGCGGLYRGFVKEREIGY